MKQTYLLLLTASIACSCSHKELVMPPEYSEKMVAMELSISSGIATKGLLKGTRLPDLSSVGITIDDPYGVYSGNSYTNVQYTSRTS